MRIISSHQDKHITQVHIKTQKNRLNLFKSLKQRHQIEVIEIVLVSLLTDFEEIILADIVDPRLFGSKRCRMTEVCLGN